MTTVEDATSHLRIVISSSQSPTVKKRPRFHGQTRRGLPGSTRSGDDSGLTRLDYYYNHQKLIGGSGETEEDQYLKGKGGASND